jgi:Ser/Thr protein kinase RdoA (MazF antagonist)
MLSSSLNFHLHRRYDILESEKIVSSSQVAHSFTNRCLIVHTDKKSYFLKKYLQLKPGRVREIYSASDFLYKQGLPVVLPFKTNENEPYFLYENSVFSLFPFIQGKSFEEVKDRTKSLISSSSYLAKLHLASKNKVLPRIKRHDIKILETKSFQDENVRLKELILQKINSGNEDELDEVTLEILELKKKSLDKYLKLLPKKINFTGNCLVHGDYFHNNLFFNENDRVKAIIDLDESKISSSVLELIISMFVMSFREEPTTKENIKLAKVFIQTYLQTNSLRYEEFYEGMLLNFLLTAQNLSFEQKRYYHNNCRTDFVLKRIHKRLSYLYHNFENFTLGFRSIFDTYSKLS